MRSAAPWGLTERLLGPGKTVTDPVHGDIHLTRFEAAVVDSPPFQRLRRVKQLGNTHLVYPGATHSRFSHALGALRVAQDLLDAALDHRQIPGACPDLFGQWERELGLGEDRSRQRDFDQKVGEAVVLARLGALTHDLCHVPFGHSVEDELRLLAAHDEDVERFERLWGEMSKTVTSLVGERFLGNLRPLILSKLKYSNGIQPKLDYPFVEDIVGNTICADLLDYLRRDHLFTGLPLALGRRFEAGFYVRPNAGPIYSERLVLRVVRDGRERTDMITEILKHLRYRYELSERVLTHHAKVAADAMVGKALVMWHDALTVEFGTARLTKGEAEATEWPAGREPQSVLDAVETASPDARDEVRQAVRDEMDTQLLMRGDDGLLEYLRDLPNLPGSSGGSWDGSRRRAVGILAHDLLNRRLFKRIARQRHISQSREAFCRDFSTPAARRRLEERAARFAGLDPAWHVAVWVPPADMRLKVADVLVDDGRETRKFVDRESESHNRGAEIPELHEQLWAVSVYAHQSVTDDQRLRLLVSLSADLNMALLERDGAPDGDFVEKPPYEWRDRLAILPLRKDRGLDEAQVVSLMEVRRRQRAARGGGSDDTSYDALAAEYAQLLPSVS